MRYSTIKDDYFITFYFRIWHYERVLHIIYEGEIDMIFRKKKKKKDKKRTKISDAVQTVFETLRGDCR